MSLPAHFDDSAWRRKLARSLLAWFDGAARDLPWRRSRELYPIWISEIMLQQTQVATVIPYFERFLNDFPTVAALAAADEQQVLRRWEGLGYYRRARQLHAAAKKIVAEHGGEFPRGYEQVRALPGIGRYTAGAILSIGLDQRVPILEANTIRVLARLAAYRGEVGTTAGQKLLWEAAERVLPAERCGAFNQSLMELGSGICTPRAPKCDACPVGKLCPTRELGLQEAIPKPKRKPTFTEVTHYAIVLRDKSRVLLRQCPAGERWAGLWDFPRFALPDEAKADPLPQIATFGAALTGCRFDVGRLLATLKHGVTRFRITLHCYEARLIKRNATAPQPTAALQWHEPSQLTDLPLSTTGRKIALLLQKAETKPTSANRSSHRIPEP